MTDDLLLISTLATSSGNAERTPATVPCLTIVCHPDPLRIGERALLTPLLVRQPALISRTRPLFAHPGDEHRRPLADPHLSREPIRLLQGATPDSVGFEGTPVQIDGRDPGATRELTAAAIEGGVLLQLSSRILLLLHRTADEAQQPLDDILGHSDAIDRLRRRVARVSGLDAPVLIRGESGTGKELVARALHAGSPRSARPLVSVNVATLTETTAVGTLFGYARGAFTGAHTSHHGLFERADGGTLFLDEVGDTPLSVQPMLLRVLETGRFNPLGDEQERSVDVRVIAATELDLEHGTRAGSFRTALKHRLAGYEIVLPALRDRPDDIARLFVHFLRLELRAFDCEELLDSDAGNPAAPLRAALMARLMRASLPGNVRQLSNLARRAAFDAAETGAIDLDAGDLSGELTSEHESERGGERATDADEPAIDETVLLAALERNRFSPLRAAAELGVAPSTIHFWMRKAKIRRAVDLDDDELRRASSECGGDLDAMAKRLRVSHRALQLQLRRRGS